MREFHDQTGVKWRIDLAFSDMVRVKTASEGRFNLFEPRELAARLAQDDAEFWELLWYLVEPQAKDRRISPLTFGQAMASDCLHVARRQFFAEMDDRGLSTAQGAGLGQSAESSNYPQVDNDANSKRTENQDAA